VKNNSFYVYPWQHSAFIYHKVMQKGGWTCHISPQNLDQTRISMPLSDTFLETVFINLPNDQIKNGCLSPHFFVKSNHKVRAIKSWKKTLQ
jgi:hypothetical protein